MKSTRRSFLARSALGGLAVTISPRLLAQSAGDARAASLYRVDGLGFPGSPAGDPSAPLTQQEISDIAGSGLTATHVTVGAVGSMSPLEAFESIVTGITRMEADIDRHPGVLARVRGVDDLRRARALGITGVIYGLQDGVAFQDDLDRLEVIHQLGVRIVQPTYNRRNLLGDGCMEPADAGLSRDGIEAVEKIQSLGMLLDLSHCGRRTTADAIEVSTRPVSFTHTGCYALAEHPRHRTDDELVEVSERGGVSGIYIMPYLSRGRQPTAADVVAHVLHAVNVAGEDHVAIGTDGHISPTTVTDEYRASFRANTRRRKELGIAAPFETEDGYLFADDLNTPDRFATLATKLADAGLNEGQVDKILGLNLMRLFSDTW